MAVIEKFTIDEKCTIDLTRQTKTRAEIKLDVENQCLQINTFGSGKRELTDEVSQTVTFSRQSLIKLKEILNKSL